MNKLDWKAASNTLPQEAKEYYIADSMDRVSTARFNTMLHRFEDEEGNGLSDVIHWAEAEEPEEDVVSRD